MSGATDTRPVPPSPAAPALLAVAGTFLYAGLAKISDPADFARAIEHYRMLPRAFAVAGALYLPWLEIGCAFAILLRGLRTGALALLALCGGVFTVMIAAALVCA